MSLNNLLKENNYDLYCNEINANIQNIATVVVDNITINNAVVLNSVTTPHITSGTSIFNTIDTLTINSQTANIGTINSQTINGLNITTENLSSQDFTSDNASINNLTVNNSLIVPSLTTPNINCDNINVSNSATINTLNVNTTITAPNISTNNITSPNGNISGLTCSNINTTNITATNANLDTISGTNLTYTNGNIDQVNGSNLSYGTGNIGDIVGANLTYDTGYIPTLSTKELTIFSALVSCPNATVDNLTVNNSFTAAQLQTPDLRADYVRSYSVGKTTFQENVVVDTQLNCPLIGVDVIQTNGSGNVNFINNVTGSNITLSNALIAPNSRTDTIDTVSGSGFINFFRPLSLPNILGSQGLAYYSYTAGTLNVTGCFTTTVNYYAVRVGNIITINIQCFSPSTNAVSTNLMLFTGFQSQYLPSLGTSTGICLVNSAAGAVAGGYKFSTGGTLNVCGNTNFGNFTAGQPCGLAGSPTEYASFNFITNN